MISDFGTSRGRIGSQQMPVSHPSRPRRKPGQDGGIHSSVEPQEEDLRLTKMTGTPLWVARSVLLECSQPFALHFAAAPHRTAPALSRLLPWLSILNRIHSIYFAGNRWMAPEVISRQSYGQPAGEISQAQSVATLPPLVFSSFVRGRGGRGAPDKRIKIAVVSRSEHDCRCRCR